MRSGGTARHGSPKGANARRHRLRNGCLALVATGVAFILVVPVSSAAGATYFVAPTGSGSDCLANSQANPFASVQVAMDCVADGDVIELAPSGATPYPGIGSISEDVTIEAAPGADARSVEVDLSSDLVTVPSTTTATIEGIALTCVDGLSPTAGACGPNVTNHGTLTLREVSVRGSTQGAAIRNLSSTGSSANLTVRNSTISDNTAALAASDRFGGGIESASVAAGNPAPTVAIFNSTIADNGVGGGARRGGGLDVTAGTAVIANSTITGNEAGGQGGGGIGTGAGAAVALSNTVVAGNTATGAGPDCLSPTGSTRIVDGAGGHNLIGNGAGCESLVGGVNGDQVGVPNPGLNDLADNGGPTDTVSLQASSPAIAAADVATCEDSPVSGDDQRGEPRDNPEGCDIGAYDTSSTGGVVNDTYFVSPTGSGSDCGANSSANPFATVQAALACTTDGDVVRLAASGATPYPGIGSIAENVRIEAGPGADARSVEVDVSPDPAEIPPGSSATIENVALTCVDGSPTVFCGPNVTNHGSLALRGVAVSGSTDGAAISSLSSGLGARLSVIDSTISGNPNFAATEGGGILSSSSGPNPATITKPTVTVANSTIADNGQGAAQGGGGIYVGAGSATLTNTTITGNHAQGGGSGGGIGTGSGAEVELSNTVVADNTVATSGAPDCDSPAVTAPITDGPGGHNLIGDGTGCTTLTDGVNGDQVGVADPGLNGLADNGGPTDTVSLGVASPAIGAADSATCEGPPISGDDQRGELRDQPAGCDIGAFEALPVTLSIDASPNVTIGGQISATATIDGLNPTGELTFNVYGPDDPSCTRINPAFTDTQPVSGNGDYASADFTPSALGTYRWTVAYSGDADNDAPSTACNAPGSLVTVTASPTIANDASPNIAIGADVSDTATLAGGHAPTGDVVFRLYGPDDASCSGAAAFTGTQPVAGNGAYASADFTPSAAGTYRWTASYGGDAANDAVSSACNAPDSTVTVTAASPTIANDASADITIGANVGDTATIAAGHSPTGNVVFRLYGPDDSSCSGAPAFTDTKPVSGNGAYASADFTPSAAGTYRWTVAYSGDAGNDAASSACNAPGSSVAVTAGQPPEPPDPGPTGPTGPTGPDPAPVSPTAPSNEFTVGKLVSRTLELTVSSAGGATIVDGAAGPQGRASTAPKQLKPSSATGGPGELRIKLRLTRSAKQTLKESGKVKVSARITFTPDGGSPNTKTERFRIKRKP